MQLTKIDKNQGLIYNSTVYNKYENNTHNFN